MINNPTLKLLIISVFIMITACHKPEKEEEKQEKIVPPLFEVSAGEYPQFKDDLDYQGLDESIRQSLVYLYRISPERRFHYENRTVTTAIMIRSLEKFSSFIQTRPSHSELNQFIRKHYQIFKAAGQAENRKVLFTGYYEPLLEGRAVRDETYHIPVYGRPRDMIHADLSLFSERLSGEHIIGRIEGNRLLPYHDRKAIEEDGVLDGKAEVIAWVKDRVDLFFLHIQGSGKIQLEPDRFINVTYQAKNGRPYRSIGRLLIDQGKISDQEMSMQRIRRYLDDYPEETSAILYHNPSYIFFAVQEKGPIGAINVPLTPGRSLAVDPKIIPLAGLAFINTHKPFMDDGGNIIEWQDCSRFVMTQDTGGAIKGPGRADLFWGNGDYAEIAAGHKKHHGDLYVLVLLED